MTDAHDPTPVERDLERAVAYLKSVGCSEIFVFGSTAGGDHPEDSDLVDLDLQERFGKQLLGGSDLRRVA